MVVIIVLVLLSFVVPFLWPLTMAAVAGYLLMGRLKLLVILGVGFILLTSSCRSRNDGAETKPVVYTVAQGQLSPTGLPIVQDNSEMHQIETGPLAHERGW
jgi:hypothetical protein